MATNVPNDLLQLESSAARGLSTRDLATALDDYGGKAKASFHITHPLARSNRTDQREVLKWFEQWLHHEQAIKGQTVGPLKKALRLIKCGADDPLMIVEYSVIHSIL